MFARVTVTLFAPLLVTLSVNAATLAPGEPHAAFEDQELAEAHFTLRYRQPVSRNKALKAEADALTEQVYQAYKRLYPQFMRNKEKPTVVLSTDQNPWESSAYLPRANGTRQGILVLTEGLISKNGIDRETQTGLIAHEMGHILFWHQDVADRVLRPITWASGETAPAEVQQGFQRWKFLSKVAGSYPYPAFDGLPVLDGFVSDDLSLIAELFRLKGQGACGEPLLEKVTGALGQMRKHYSNYRADFVFDTPGAMQDVGRLSRNIVQSIRSCIESQPDLNERFVQIRRHTLDGKHIDATTIYQRAAPALRAEAFASDFDFFMAVSRAAHTEMNVISRRYHLQNVRWYSGEDQADEAATTVLKHLGLDHAKYAAALVDSLELTQSDALQCRERLTDNTEPPYGRLADHHHSNCWRAWRIIGFGAKHDRLPDIR